MLWLPREELNIRLTTTLPADSALLLPTNGEALNRRQILLTLGKKQFNLTRLHLSENLCWTYFCLCSESTTSYEKVQTFGNIAGNSTTQRLFDSGISGNYTAELSGSNGVFLTFGLRINQV